MGIFFAKPKKHENKSKDVFERKKEEVKKQIEEAKKNADPKNKRTGKLIATAAVKVPQGSTLEPIVSIPAHLRSYDEVALDEMRNQLNHDASTFLLNNILLSVQFFENYEREMQQISDTPISTRENLINETMIRFNKHVFFGDRLLDCINNHVTFQRSRSQLETLASSRFYIVFDNVEARVQGDTSDYSAALDAPYYKLCIEECKEQGYLKLQKLEVLESVKQIKDESVNYQYKISGDSIYLHSENENNDADSNSSNFANSKLKIRNELPNATDKGNVNDKFQTTSIMNELKNQTFNITQSLNEEDPKPKKSILKNTRYSNAGSRYIKAKDRFLSHPNNLSDTEYGSSGYESILSSGSTISDSAIPKRIELLNKKASSSGIFLDDTWTEVVKVTNKQIQNKKEMVDLETKQHIENVDSSSDEDDDEMIDSAYKAVRYMHKRSIYLNSTNFMNQFITNFKQDLGRGLGFPQNAIRNAMTHGAKIYCDTLNELFKMGYEIIPGLSATWPSVANLWIIRERKIVQNPRNNFLYQWPVNYMVNKVRDFGCLLVPLGYRPKIGSNPDEKLQWRIVFPEAERYLESQLAHAHIRCYLFSLLLHKTFMENEMMIGIDASHIKNHLFWQCEDNFAKWPEDRLGDSLKYFLESFYTHFGKSNLPNYFMEGCNDFEGISTSVLLLLQRKLKDIIDTIVMHTLYAIDKLKYNSIGFYPTFDCQRLYDILTNKNPLYLSNPNLSASGIRNEQSKKRKKIKTNIPIPKRLEPERRHLVLKFFIPHFIAMARSSEKFNAINQAMIYLEQARRLCYLLLDQPGEGTTANEYLEVICDKLADCQRKKAKQDGFMPGPQMDYTERPGPSSSRQYFKTENVVIHKVSQDSALDNKVKVKIPIVESQQSIIEDRGIPAITVADIHSEELNRSNVKVDYDSSIPLVTVADIHVEKTHGKKLPEKERITQNDRVLTNNTVDIYKKEHVQLDDNIIEESYL